MLPDKAVKGSDHEVILTRVKIGTSPVRRKGRNVSSPKRSERRTTRCEGKCIEYGRHKYFKLSTSASCPVEAKTMPDIMGPHRALEDWSSMYIILKSFESTREFGRSWNRCDKILTR